ncbi:MAG: 30S ribosome-binding factor RbfA [Candidatus Omnitrophota bacterium]
MTQKKNYRIAQVNRLLQEEIADILLTEIDDERLKQITLTEVRAAKDLSHAIVFITLHKSGGREELLEAVHRASGAIRKLLNSRIRLKRIPELDFRYDDSLDRAERITRILDRLHVEIQDDIDSE